MHWAPSWVAFREHWRTSDEFVFIGFKNQRSLSRTRLYTILGVASSEVGAHLKSTSAWKYHKQLEVTQGI